MDTEFSLKALYDSLKKCSGSNDSEFCAPPLNNVSLIFHFFSTTHWPKFFFSVNRFVELLSSIYSANKFIHSLWSTELFQLFRRVYTEFIVPIGSSHTSSSWFSTFKHFLMYHFALFAWWWCHQYIGHFAIKIESKKYWVHTACWWWTIQSCRFHWHQSQ